MEVLVFAHLIKVVFEVEIAGSGSTFN